MIAPAPNGAWSTYKQRLPVGRELYQVYLPADLPVRGKIGGSFDYVPPDRVLAALQAWMTSHHEKELYYFLTESVGDEPADFIVTVSSLTDSDLRTVNRGRENALVATTGSWAIFIDHEGVMHVAGPADLFEAVKAAGAT